jgi:hypothetical protein
VEIGKSDLVSAVARLRSTAMNRCAATTLAVIAASVVGLFAAPSALGDTLTPQPGATCGPANTNAQTVSPQGVLICQESQWQQVPAFLPPVQTVFTYGPPTTLTNGFVNPGEFWVGIPVLADGVCTEEQSAGGPPESYSNNVGQYFDFGLKPGLTSLKLSGYCNWQMTRAVGEPPPRA